MTSRRKKRNTMIKKEIRSLQAAGLKIKDAVPIVADKYCLSEHRIFDIWYDKKISDQDRPDGINLRSHLLPALIMMTVLFNQYQTIF